MAMTELASSSASSHERAVVDAADSYGNSNSSHGSLLLLSPGVSRRRHGSGHNRRASSSTLNSDASKWIYSSTQNITFGMGPQSRSSHRRSPGQNGNSNITSTATTANNNTRHSRLFLEPFDPNRIGKDLSDDEEEDEYYEQLAVYYDGSHASSSSATSFELVLPVKSDRSVSPLTFHESVQFNAMKLAGLIQSPDLGNDNSASSRQQRRQQRQQQRAQRQQERRDAKQQRNQREGNSESSERRGRGLQRHHSSSDEVLVAARRSVTSPQYQEPQKKRSSSSSKSKRRRNQADCTKKGGNLQKDNRHALTASTMHETGTRRSYRSDDDFDDEDGNKIYADELDDELAPKKPSSDSDLVGKRKKKKRERKRDKKSNKEQPCRLHDNKTVTKPITEPVSKSDFWADSFSDSNPFNDVSFPQPTPRPVSMLHLPTSEKTPTAPKPDPQTTNTMSVDGSLHDIDPRPRKPNSDSDLSKKRRSSSKNRSRQPPSSSSPSPASQDQRLSKSTHSRGSSRRRKKKLSAEDTTDKSSKPSRRKHRVIDSDRQDDDARNDHDDKLASLSDVNNIEIMVELDQAGKLAPVQTAVESPADFHSGRQATTETDGVPDAVPRGNAIVASMQNRISQPSRPSISRRNLTLERGKIDPPENDDDELDEYEDEVKSLEKNVAVPSRSLPQPLPLPPVSTPSGRESKLSRSSSHSKSSRRSTKADRRSRSTSQSRRRLKEKLVRSSSKSPSSSSKRRSSSRSRSRSGSGQRRRHRSKEPKPSSFSSSSSRQRDISTSPSPLEDLDTSSNEIRLQERGIGRSQSDDTNGPSVATLITSSKAPVSNSSSHKKSNKPPSSISRKDSFSSSTSKSHRSKRGSSLTGSRRKKRGEVSDAAVQKCQSMKTLNVSSLHGTSFHSTVSVSAKQPKSERLYASSLQDSSAVSQQSNNVSYIDPVTMATLSSSQYTPPTATATTAASVISELSSRSGTMQSYAPDPPGVESTSILGYGYCKKPMSVRSDSEEADDVIDASDGKAKTKTKKRSKKLPSSQSERWIKTSFKTKTSSASSSKKKSSKKLNISSGSNDYDNSSKSRKKKKKKDKSRDQSYESEIRRTASTELVKQASMPVITSRTPSARSLSSKSSNSSKDQHDDTFSSAEPENSISQHDVINDGVVEAKPTSTSSLLGRSKRSKSVDRGSKSSRNVRDRSTSPKRRWKMFTGIKKSFRRKG